MTLTAAILLASERHAAFDAPLALTPWIEQDTLIEWRIAKLVAAGVRDIVVVLGYEAQRVLPLVTGDNVEAIIDARWANGPASSLRVGASAVPRGTTTALILDIAQPRSAALCRAMLDAHETCGSAITRAARDGVPCTPVVVDEAALAALRHFTGDGGLDAFVAGYAGSVVDVSVEGDEALVRIDAPADVEAARVALGVR